MYLSVISNIPTIDVRKIIRLHVKYLFKQDIGNKII